MNLLKKDRASCFSKKLLPIVLILDHLRSASNVGNIFRIAEALRIKKIYALGYTPIPPHPKLKKTARQTDRVVEFEARTNGIELLKELKKKGYQIIGVDTFSDCSSIWDSTFSGSLALLFGNEALGINHILLKYCDTFLSVPMFGFKNSINVSNCVSAVLYTLAKNYYQK